MSTNHAQIMQDLEQVRHSGDAAALRLRLVETVKRNSHAPEMVHQLGLQAAQWGCVDDAVAILEDCARLSPNRAAIHNDLGVLYHQQRRLIDASNAFQRALDCDQTFTSALDNLLSIKVEALLGLAQAESEEGKVIKATKFCGCDRNTLPRAPCSIVWSSVRRPWSSKRRAPCCCPSARSLRINCAPYFRNSF
jgi:tetratricopeptide (TPR) repeat protein